MKMGLVMKYTSIPQILLHILKEHDEYYHLIYNLLGNSVMIILNIRLETLRYRTNEINYTFERQ